MAIISLSLNDTLIQELDALQDALGFSGRSEIVRTAVRDFITTQKKQDDITGVIEGVVLIIYLEKNGSAVSEIWHSYKKGIKSQIHNCLENEKCLQILIIESDAKIIHQLMQDLKSSPKVDFAQLFIS
jgi:CopG family nickel-responsive transcriptional regulator